MDYEKKKKVPQHLRGAKNAKKRWWCGYCEEWHPHPVSFCTNRPGGEKLIEARRAARSANGKKSYYENGGKERFEAGRNMYIGSPAQRMQARKTIMKVNEMLRKSGRRFGKGNPNYGNRLSLEQRLRMSTAITIAKNQLRLQDMDRVTLPPTIPTESSFDFFRTTVPSSERDEFSAGEILDRWNSNGFDPFG